MSDMDIKEQIILTASGILVAIIAAFLTYFLTRFQENKKSEKLYFKTFEIIDATFDWHLSQLNRLDKSLGYLEEASVKSRNIIIDKFPARFNSSIIQKSVENLISFKGCDEKLVKLLVFYSNHIEELNEQLDFSEIHNTMDKIELFEKEESIRSFFSEIRTEYVEKLKTEIELSRKMMKNAR